MTPGAAAAADTAFAIRAIVVRQFFPDLDVPCRSDPDGVPENVDIAVRVARMVNETSQVAADRCVANPAAIDLKAPDLPAFHVPPLTAKALLMRNALTRVVDDPRVLGNRFDRDHAPAVELRTLSFDAAVSHRRRRHRPSSVAPECAAPLLRCSDV